jgi:hypothetical protein
MTTLYPIDYGNVAPGGHCGVLAVAIFAGRTFQEAWDALKRPGRWSGGTNQYRREAVLKQWGIACRHVLHVTGREFRVTGTTSPLLCYAACLPRCSVETFARKYAKPGVTYMIRIRGHVLTLRDGIAIDQTNACPVELYPLRRSIVTHSSERIAA